MQKKRIKLIRPDKWKLDKPIFAGKGGDMKVLDDPHFNGLYKKTENVLPQSSTARQIFDSKVINEISLSQMQDLIAFEGYEYWYEQKYGTSVPDEEE